MHLARTQPGNDKAKVAQATVWWERSRHSHHGNLVRMGAEADADKGNLAQDDVMAKLAAAEAEAAKMKEELDMMQKLAAAEREAAKLREELKEQQQVTGEQKDPLAGLSIDELAREKIPTRAQGRVPDGSNLRREQFPGFGSSGTGSGWLSESDVSQVQQESSLLQDASRFLAKADPSEVGPATVTKEEAEKDRRDLILGLGGGAVALGLSQVPLRFGAPAKPLFFYLVPLVRIQGLLAECKGLAENGYWDQLRTASQRILREPNEAKDNLLQAAGSLDGKAQDEAVQKAFEILEAVEGLDYKVYLEAFVPPTGKDALAYQQYTIGAVATASKTLEQFLKSMDPESVDAARSQVEALNPVSAAPAAGVNSDDEDLL